MADPRLYPDRPFIAVSAAIFRDGKVLLVRRARAPARDVFTLPGGVVEVGETLTEAVRREILEETGALVEPIGLAGHREVIVHDAEGRAERHFVILAFTARLVSGEPAALDEVAEVRWVDPSEIASLPTTDGLADIVAAALRVESAG